jgi:hypothetical protein
MKRISLILVLVLALTMALAPAAGASQPQGPLRIRTLVDFATGTGVFWVDEGAELLGCSGGTRQSSWRGRGCLDTEFTCTSGAGAGDTFVLLSRNCCPPPGQGPPGPGVGNGHWNAGTSTGHFAGMRGRGDFWFYFADDGWGEEHYAGEIHFHP